MGLFQAHSQGTGRSRQSIPRGNTEGKIVLEDNHRAKLEADKVRAPSGYRISMLGKAWA